LSKRTPSKRTKQQEFGDFGHTNTTVHDFHL
jgi:hypothetical protein